MNKIRYFDHAATTYVKDEVLKEMIPYFGLNYGNPSSLYSIGRQNKRAIELAREKVANVIGAKPKEIYFTSCGSESDNLAIKGFAYANNQNKNHIITSKIEHHAVLNSCKTLERQGFRVTYLNVDKNGKISLNELENAITKETGLITIMTANNEIRNNTANKRNCRNSKKTQNNISYRRSSRNRKYKNKCTKTRNRYAKHVSTQILWT